MLSYNLTSRKLGSDSVTNQYLKTKVLNTLFWRVCDGTLKSGIQLREELLASELGVRRTVIQLALLDLENSGIVSYERNKGNYIVVPTREQTFRVMEMRTMIESWIWKKCALSVNEHTISCILENIKNEDRAHKTGDIHRMRRLSCEFHLMMSMLAGNIYISQQLEALVALTTLSEELYGQTEVHSCSAQKHLFLLEALKAPKSRSPEREIERHVAEIWQKLKC